MMLQGRGEVGRVVVELVQMKYWRLVTKNWSVFWVGEVGWTFSNHTEDCYVSCMGPTWNFSF